MRKAVVPLLLVLLACGEPEPKSPQKHSGDVPANSLSDAQLHGTDGKSDAPRDPSQPLITKVGETPIDPDALAPAPQPASGTGGKNASKPAKPEPPAAGGGGGKGAVSKADCDRAFDKYLNLELASNPQLKDLPPEVLAQVKEQGKQQHGEAPCTATRAQYNCAMSASTTAAWQKCMK